MSWYIRDDYELTVIPKNSVNVSVTNPEFTCMKTDTGEQVGLRFISEKTQIHIVLGIKEFHTILTEIQALE